MMNDWAKRDARAAASFLQQQVNHPAYDTMAGAYARGLAAIDPPTALAWAQSLRGEDQRTASVSAIAAGWVKTEGEGALPKLRAAGYSEEFIAGLPASFARQPVDFAAVPSWISSARGNFVPDSQRIALAAYEFKDLEARHLVARERYYRVHVRVALNYNCAQCHK